ncbi:MAG: hypothetical protein Q8P57_03590 [Candidatus Pacearchaeota archaeon]|nr:hypothetical protein [Candidatus Pacearchaeota archaeon]
MINYKVRNAWECECGFIEYKELPPEECSKCWKENSFVEIPEDKMDEITEGHLLGEIRDEDWEDD